VAAVFTCNAEAIDRLDPFRGDGPTQTISSVQATRAAAAKAWNTDAAKTHPPADNLTVDQARQIAVTSRDLASDNGGSSPGRRWASIVLPTGRAGHHQVMGTGRGDLNCEPGPPHRRGPQWVPAPATECRSGQPLVQLPQCSDAPHLDALDQAGLGEVVDGYYNGRPSRLAASTAGSTPFTGRTRPSSANSPSSTVFSSRSHAFLPLADKTAEASASAKGRLIQF